MYYFDNSATTKVYEEVAQKAYEMMTVCFGNPSSVHSMGFNAEKELRTARQTLKDSLSVTKGELIFTSGGTESNNLAILGIAEQYKKTGKRIVTTQLEHASVLGAMKELETRGFEVIYLKPNSEGFIDTHDIIRAITADTILVSVMSVNNETGAILPIEFISKVIKRNAPKAFFHVDHVQGFQKVKLKAKDIDLISISAHKVHAPKGCGALYMADRVRLKPIIFGSSQEKSIRPGTENVSSAVAFSHAVSLNKKGNVEELNRYLRDELEKIPEIEINSPKDASPYILNISIGKIKGETMLHFLSNKGIYVSTGSACTGSNLSHVLTAMGLSREKVESSLRISFSKMNTIEEVEVLISALKEGLFSLAYRE